MISLSSTEIETASPCVPSRSDVSKVWMRMELLGDRGGFLLLRYALLLLFLAQESHHLPEFLANPFDWLIMCRLPHREELMAARLVFADPFLGKLAGLNLGQNLLHFLACLSGDNTGAARVIA